MGHPYFALPRPVVIGHRGCAGEVPENTLASFERGLAEGAAILESDVHLTCDGVPVLSHDPDVARTTNGAGLIHELAWAEIAALDAGHTFVRAGDHPYRGKGLRIPSLREALDAFPDARFNLELKHHVPGIVERTLDIIAAANAAERTLLTAENAGLMAQVHAQLDARSLDAARGASAADVLAFVRCALDASPPPAGPMALQVPAEFGGAPLVTAEFVAHAHAHDLEVHVWTINERSEMQRLLDLGVDGLVTDHPGRLSALIHSADA